MSIRKEQVDLHARLLAILIKLENDILPTLIGKVGLEGETEAEQLLKDAYQKIKEAKVLLHEKWIADISKSLSNVLGDAINAVLKMKDTNDKAQKN